MGVLKRIILTLFIVLFSSNCYAVEYAIRLDCANNGDGTSWSCAAGTNGAGACNTIPTAPTRGDTYYFSSGTYTAPDIGYKCNVADSGSNYITFKKATDADYGGLIGWTSSIDGGQTIFKASATSKYNVVFWAQTDYYKFDGVRGSMSSNPEDYGFKFTYIIDTTPVSYLVFNQSSYAPNYWQFYHIAMVNIGPSKDIDQMNVLGVFADGVYKHCLLSTSGHHIHASGPNTLIDHCYFKDNWSSASHHGEIGKSSADNITISNCIINNSINGTGGFGTALESGSAVADGWKFFNNIIFGGIAGNGIIFTGTSVGTQGISNAKIYNNTVVGVQRLLYKHPNTNGSGNEVNNNLFYNANASQAYYHGTISSFNYYNTNCSSITLGETGSQYGESIDPFVDSANHNYRLNNNTIAKDTGTDLTGTFTTDIIGTNRPQGIAWDIGAYEFRSNTPMIGVYNAKGMSGYYNANGMVGIAPN